MKKLNKEIGDLGERFVSELLINRDYYIFENNFICNIGEIDIIARKDDYLCFIEVKSRYSLKYGTPCEAIDCYKQRKIKKIAQFFIMKNNLHNYIYRFDIAEVIFSINGDYIINYIENAF